MTTTSVYVGQNPSLNDVGELSFGVWRVALNADPRIVRAARLRRQQAPATQRLRTGDSRYFHPRCREACSMARIEHARRTGANRFDTIAERIDDIRDFLPGFDPNAGRRAEYEYARNRCN